MATKPKMKGKYGKSADEKKDSYLMKKAGLTPAERKKFEKMDEAHGKKKKPKTLQEDAKIDKSIINKIKSERKNTKRKK